MPAKTFRVRIMPMADAIRACIKVPFDVEQVLCSKARIEKTLAMLAFDDMNSTGARHLYERLGFTVVHRDLSHLKDL